MRFLLVFMSFSLLFSIYELYHSGAHSVQFFHHDGYGYEGCPAVLALLCRINIYFWLYVGGMHVVGFDESVHSCV